jgi:hypothetical protein
MSSGSVCSFASAVSRKFGCTDLARREMLISLSPALPCMAERMFSTELGCCILVPRELVVSMNFWSAILALDPSEICSDPELILLHYRYTTLR